MRKCTVSSVSIGCSQARNVHSCVIQNVINSIRPFSTIVNRVNILSPFHNNVATDIIHCVVRI